MKFSEIIGIDVSKETLDVKIHTEGLMSQFENTESGYTNLIKWVLAITKLGI